MSKKKTKKTEINKAVAEELSGRIEMDRQDQKQELESRLQEIYGRPHAMTSEEQILVQALKEEINQLNK